MNLKRFLLLLSFLIVAILPIQTAFAAFSDTSERYEAAVNYVVSKGYAAGLNDTQFGVSAEIKRIDAAVMIARVKGYSPTDSYPNAGFTDVPEVRQWAVNALAANGIMNGINGTTFGSNQTMTREQMAMVLATTYNLTATNMNIPFTDLNSNTKPSIAALVENNITSGTTATLFGSKDNIKRGDFAIFIYKAEMDVTTLPPEVISVE